MSNNSKTVPIVGFYGFSHSGKTSVVFQLIRKLKLSGLRTAVIKRTNKAISSENNDKDTYGFRAAGAKITSFVSSIETNFVIGKEVSTNQIIKTILDINEVDLILIEGAIEKDIKKVRFGNIPLRENTIYKYDNDLDGLYNLIIKMIIGEKMTNISIEINGKIIPLTDFPAKIIANTIIGMLKSLRNVEEIESVVIKLEK